jgi:hypothetical protein
MPLIGGIPVVRISVVGISVVGSRVRWPVPGAAPCRAWPGAPAVGVRAGALGRGTSNRRRRRRRRGGWGARWGCGGFCCHRPSRILWQPPHRPGQPGPALRPVRGQARCGARSRVIVERGGAAGVEAAMRICPCRAGAVRMTGLLSHGVALPRRDPRGDAHRSDLRGPLNAGPYGLTGRRSAIKLTDQTRPLGIPSGPIDTAFSAPGQGIPMRPGGKPVSGASIRIRWAGW